MRIPIVKDAYLWLFFVMIAGFLLGFVDWRLWIIASGLFVFMLVFFRDPVRVLSECSEQCIVAPADGKVILVDDKNKRISIFMSIFNVHLNYAPITGEVRSLNYKKGSFLPANLESASLRNETNCIEIESIYGKVWMKQIAGLIARRICCYPGVGTKVKIGEKVGLIKFGSRVDLELPSGAEIYVRFGERVTGGKTIIGRLN